MCLTSLVARIWEADEEVREQEELERQLEEEVSRREAELQRMRQARLAEAEKDIMQDFDQSIAMVTLHFSCE